jgi:hypothetical protein
LLLGHGLAVSPFSPGAVFHGDEVGDNFVGMEPVDMAPVEDAFQIGKSHDDCGILSISRGGGLGYLTHPLGPLTAGKIGNGNQRAPVVNGA